MMQLCWGRHSLLGSPLAVANCLNAQSGALFVTSPPEHDIEEELNMILMMALSHIDTCMAQYVHNFDGGI